MRTTSKHGTLARYNRGCRCRRCRTAKRDYVRARRAVYRNLKGFHVPHGTPNGYINYGCRCQRCSAAERDRKRGYRERRAAR